MRHKAGNGHNVNLEKFLDDIKVVVQDGENLLKTGASELKQRAISGAKSTDKLVRKNPYKTVGILFGVGLLVGLVVSGMMSGSEEELEEEM